MIPNYSHPQTTITQELASTTAEALENNHALIIGPAYRHTTDATLEWETYLSGDSIDYTSSIGGPPAGGVVDSDSVQLRGRNLHFTLWTKEADSAATDDFIQLAGDYSGNIIQYSAAAGFYNTGDGTAALDFDNGRPPAIGDVYDITKGATTVRRSVTALLGKDLAAEVAAVGYSGAYDWQDGVNDFGTSSFTTTVTGGVEGTHVVQDDATCKLISRLYGTVAPAAVGGLRGRVVLTCVTGGGVAAAAFTGTYNGYPIDVAGVLSGSDSKLELTYGSTQFFDVLVDSAVTWTAGDIVQFDLDYTNAGDSEIIAALGANITLTSYTNYTGTRLVADTLVVEVTTLTATHVTYRISSVGGLATVTTQAIAVAAGATAVAVPYDGSSITVTITGTDGAEAHVGQRWTAQITPPRRSTTIFDKVQLNAPIGFSGGVGDDALSVTAYYKTSGTYPATEPVDGGANYVVGTTGISTLAVTASVPGYPTVSSVKTAASGEGTVAVEWRATFAAEDETFRIDTLDDIIARYGSYEQDSELPHALAWALSGSQGKPVFGLNTGNVTEAAFTAALTLAESAFQVRYLSLVSDDLDVLGLAAPHCQAMSVENVKRFRRAYVGIDSPAEYYKVSLQDDESPYIGDINTGSGSGYTLVTFDAVDGFDLTELNIEAGDYVEVSGSGDRYVISEVTGENTLTLASGPAVPVLNAALTVVASDSATNIARYVWEAAEALGAAVDEDRRINCIWIDNGTYQDVAKPNRFLAAETAGLRSAVLPQLGLTRTEMLSVDAAPTMYTKFTTAVLDSMAERGVWVVTQNAPDLACYVRHQLTTAVSNGSLFYEDSAGVNLDDLSFVIDGIIDPWIGKYNAVAKTVSLIKNALVTRLDQATQADIDSAAGPQIVAYYNEAGEEGTIDVAIDDTLKDTINFFIEVQLPLPFNHARVKLRGTTIRGDGTSVTTISSITSA